MPKPVTSFPHGNCRETKIGRYADSAEEELVQRKKRQNDHSINPYASHSSFVKSGQRQACPSTEPARSIIHDSYKDEKCMRNVKRKAPWQWPTLPGGRPPSTIGADGLNYRVRDVTGCTPVAPITKGLFHIVVLNSNWKDFMKEFLVRKSNKFSTSRDSALDH